MSTVDAFSFSVSLEAVAYLNCLKVSDKVFVDFDIVDGRARTEFRFIRGDSTYDGCFFAIDGNPYAMNDGERAEYDITPGGSFAPLGAAPAPAAGGLITRFTFGELDGTGAFEPLWLASRLPGVTAAEFISILTDSTTSYRRFITLFDDATRVNGSDMRDVIEVGAGDDRVNAGDGDDIVHRWRAGDLTYDGGAGSDTLTFKTSTGVGYPTPPVQQMVANLRSGTVTNPYGGTITLAGVENIVGTPWADVITGDNGANVIGDGVVETAGDIIDARGGDDTVKLFSFAGFFPALDGADIDGGKGVDTLVFQYDFTGNVLDLGDPSLSAGMFRDSIFRSIERFVVGPDFGTSFGALTFRGDDGANHLEVRQGLLSISMGGGDDTLVLLARTTSDPVAADGGGGTDRLVFVGADLSFVLDLANPADNTGPFAGGTFTGFEIFEVGPDQPGTVPSVASFDFRGDGRDNTVIGGRIGDLLSGHGGRDALQAHGGDDRLDGGQGRDTLTGGNGADEFRFGNLGGTDLVTDLQTGTDRIVLSAAVFAALGPTVGAGELRLGPAALDGNDRLLYDAATGLLAYDADADGAVAAVVFADIGADQALTSADFVIA